MVRLSERLRRWRPAEVAPAPPEQALATPSPEPIAGDLSAPRGHDLHRDAIPGRLANEAHSVSRALYERLGAEDVAEAERLLRETPEFADLQTVDPGLRRMLALHCAIWHRLGAVVDKTGLTPDQPPEDVHAMARGPLAAAGALYEADLVADALCSAGSDAAAAGSGLDFGCSSGRVVRVLAAAYPDLRWVGCDPNKAAIAWAKENLRGIEFFVSRNQPPLSLPDASLGLAFGISIWSHFEPQLGLAWFEEMRRVLRSGGYLVITTHGLASVGHYASNGLRTYEQCEEIEAALYQRGWWYAPEFGKAGDWGVVSPAWGTAFVSPEWLLAELCPKWRLLEFAPGRNAGNQDVYVLQRV